MNETSQATEPIYIVEQDSNEAVPVEELIKDMNVVVARMEMLATPEPIRR